MTIEDLVNHEKAELKPIISMFRPFRNKKLYGLLDVGASLVDDIDDARSIVVNLQRVASLHPEVYLIARLLKTMDNYTSSPALHQVCNHIGSGVYDAVELHNLASMHDKFADDFKKLEPDHQKRFIDLTYNLTSQKYKYFMSESLIEFLLPLTDVCTPEFMDYFRLQHTGLYAPNAPDSVWCTIRQQPFQDLVEKLKNFDHPLRKEIGTEVFRFSVENIQPEYGAFILYIFQGNMEHPEKILESLKITPGKDSLDVIKNIAILYSRLPCIEELSPLNLNIYAQ